MAIQAHHVVAAAADAISSDVLARSVIAFFHVQKSAYEREANDPRFCRS